MAWQERFWRAWCNGPLCGMIVIVLIAVALYVAASSISNWFLIPIFAAVILAGLLFTIAEKKIAFGGIYHRPTDP